MIKIGNISEVSEDKSLVRVDYLGTISDFIPYMQTANSFKKHFIPPQVGEQVLLFELDGANYKVAMGSIFSQDCKEPSQSSASKEVMEYQDGTTISYDISNSTLEVLNANSINIVLKQSCNLEVPELNLKGNIKINGTLESGDIKVGNIVSSGTIKDIRGDLTNHTNEGKRRD